LDEDETAVLASQVDVKNFSPRERIYKIGEPSSRVYVTISDKVQVTTVDEDQRDAIIDEPAKGGFFGFASMLDMTPHQTNAIALEMPMLGGGIADLQLKSSPVDSLNNLSHKSTSAGSRPSV
jgi:CRP-like cAMP-binding protein